MPRLVRLAAPAGGGWHGRQRRPARSWNLIAGAMLAGRCTRRERHDHQPHTDQVPVFAAIELPPGGTSESGGGYEAHAPPRSERLRCDPDGLLGRSALSPQQRIACRATRRPNGRRAPTVQRASDNRVGRTQERAPESGAVRRSSCRPAGGTRPRGALRNPHSRRGRPSRAPRRCPPRRLSGLHGPGRQTTGWRCR